MMLWRAVSSRHSTQVLSVLRRRKSSLTSDLYGITRSDVYAKITEEDVKHFRSILDSQNQLLTTVDGSSSSNDLDEYNQDWMRKYKGQSSLILKPRSAQQLSKIMKHCNERKLAVVPQGGNTGLVGGSNPVFDEIVISTALLNQIKSFDKVSGILVAESGCILENLDNYIAKEGYIFPLDLGAKGSCHIGGNVATNAGGLRLLRYGSLHGNVLGIEAVLADGTIVENLSTLRKDNTGYDLKQLFIGSEGTIGIITAVSVVCPQRSNATNVSFLGVESFQAVQQTFIQCKKHLSEILSAFEFMDEHAFGMVTKHTGSKKPLEGSYPFYVLVETSGSNGEHDSEKLENFLTSVLEDGTVEDGVLAQDETQLRSIWGLREGIPEALSKTGGVYKYDVSIPLEQLYDLVTDTRERVKAKGLLGEGKPVIEVVGYGHVGDGNLHLNIVVKEYSKEIEGVLEPFIYEWIESRNGSISAEHGIGLAKRKYMKYSKNDQMITLMKYARYFI